MTLRESGRTARPWVMFRSSIKIPPFGRVQAGTEGGGNRPARHRPCVSREPSIPRTLHGGKGERPLRGRVRRAPPSRVRPWEGLLSLDFRHSGAECQPAAAPADLSLNRLAPHPAANRHSRKGDTGGLCPSAKDKSERIPNSPRSYDKNQKKERFTVPSPHPGLECC